MILILTLISILPVAGAKEDRKFAMVGKLQTIQTDNGSVTWKYVEDDKYRWHWWTGGSVYRITVDNTHFNEPHAGSQITFQVVAISAALLSMKTNAYI